MKCAICDTRRPRRTCPAVRGDICAVCCGESREATLDCPLDCTHLEEARRHEQPPELDPEKIPNKDVEITEQFAVNNATLFNLVGRAMARITSSSAGVTDHDARESIDAMIRTYRTLESGLIYETRPANLIAADIQQRLRGELDEARKQLREQHGMETVRDTDVLGVLVMFQRLELGRNNGRPRSRAFIGFLRREFGE